MTCRFLPKARRIHTPIWLKFFAALGFVAALLITPLTSWAAPLPQIDIAYGTNPENLLDIYQPDGSGLHHLVVFVHGGGWTGGKKRSAHAIAASITGAGYVLASVEYRKVPQTTPAGQAADVAQAIAFLLAHSKEYGVAPGGFAIMGHSAGAHLAALLATDAHYLSDVRVDPTLAKAFVSLDGFYDIDAHMAVAKHGAEVFGTDPAQWGGVSPVKLLSKSPLARQFCLLHSGVNPRFADQAERFAEALRAAGDHVQVAAAPGRTHGQLMDKFADPNEPMLGFTIQCLKSAGFSNYTNPR